MFEQINVYITGVFIKQHNIPIMQFLIKVIIILLNYCLLLLSS